MDEFPSIYQALANYVSRSGVEIIMRLTINMDCVESAALQAAKKN